LRFSDVQKSLCGPLQVIQVCHHFGSKRQRNLNKALAQKYPNSFSQNAKERGNQAHFGRAADSVWLRAYFFFEPIFFRADDIDGSGVERGFDVHRVIFLDHPDARATVLSDLIDVGSLHQPQADIRVP
jgi:hypothetical protein